MSGCALASRQRATLSLARGFLSEAEIKTWLGGTSLTAVFWVNSMVSFIQGLSTDPSTDWRVQ